MNSVIVKHKLSRKRRKKKDIYCHAANIKECGLHCLHIPIKLRYQRCLWLYELKKKSFKLYLPFSPHSPPLAWPSSSCWSYCWRCLKPSVVKQPWTSQSSQPCSPSLSTSCACCSPQCTSWCAHLPRAPVTSAASPGVSCLLLLPSPLQCFVFWSLWQHGDSPWDPGFTGR